MNSTFAKTARNLSKNYLFRIILYFNFVSALCISHKVVYI